TDDNQPRARLVITYPWEDASHEPVQGLHIRKMAKAPQEEQRKWLAPIRAELIQRSIDSGSITVVDPSLERRHKAQQVFRVFPAAHLDAVEPRQQPQLIAQGAQILPACL